MYNTKVSVYDDGALEIFLCSGEAIVERRYVTAPLTTEIIRAAVNEFTVKCDEANAEFYKTCNVLRGMGIRYTEATDADREANYNLIV